MQRKQISLSVDIIQTAGINVFADHSSYNVWKFVMGFTLYISLDIFGFMASITNIGNFYKFAAPIPYVAGSVVVQGGIFFIYYHRKMIGRFLYEMDKNFHTYPDEHLLEIEYVWYLQEENIDFLIRVAKYPSLSSVLIIAMPVLGEAIFYGRIKTFIYPIWSPWKIDSLGIELLVSAVQFIQVFLGVWYNYVTMVFLFISVTEFMRQFQRLIAAVQSLEIRTLEKLAEGGNFDRILRENIIHCTRHHQILIKNFRIFEIWFSIFFSIELAVSLATLTFALYLAMNASNLSEIVNCIPVVLFIWSGLLLRCLISEIFPHLNENLADSIFWDVPWYQVDEENRKLLKMFHSTACQPLILHGLSVFEATRVTFGKMVRITYSFLNVLKRKGSINT